MVTNMIALKLNISIVIPVYNSEQYLVRCLDSVFKQKFTGTFEVIAVDDNSTDSSLQMLKNYQVKEEKLKIIHHVENFSLPIARVTGMKETTGEYVMHIDSDDWLMPNALENLYKKCKETNADVLVFNYSRQNTEGIITLTNTIKKELITNNKLKVQHLFFGSDWNKIVKRTLTDNMLYGKTKLKSTEDLIYCTEILLRAEKICLITECFYVYCENQLSISSTTLPVDYLKTQMLVLKIIKEITLNYSVDPAILSNILNYLIKNTFLLIAKRNLLKNKDLTNTKQLINEFLEPSIITPFQIFRIKLSMKNKYFSLLEVTILYGLWFTLKMVLISSTRIGQNFAKRKTEKMNHPGASPEVS